MLRHPKSSTSLSALPDSRTSPICHTLDDPHPVTPQTLQVKIPLLHSAISWASQTGNSPHASLLSRRTRRGFGVASPQARRYRWSPKAGRELAEWGADWFAAPTTKRESQQPALGRGHLCAGERHADPQHQVHSGLLANRKLAVRASFQHPNRKWEWRKWKLNNFLHANKLHKPLQYKSFAQWT